MLSQATAFQYIAHLTIDRFIYMCSRSIQTRVLALWQAKNDPQASRRTSLGEEKKTQQKLKGFANIFMTELALRIPL